MVDNKDLLERTQKFSEEIITLVRSLPQDSVSLVLAKQLIRSATSIGANYREGCEAESAKDFVHKIRISKKEARESIYWMELIKKANPSFIARIDRLNSKCEEFVKIFSSISSKFTF